MLDISLIREQPQLVKASLKKRNQQDKIPWIDELQKKDAQWRTLKGDVDRLRHRRNTLSLEINRLKKEGKEKEFQKALKDAKEIPHAVAEKEYLLKQLEHDIHEKMLHIPNLLHPDVPTGKDANDNKEIKRWGKQIKFTFQPLSHVELAEALGIAEFEQGRNTSGQGFNYLFRELALLDMALQQYGIDFLLKRGFSLVAPPLMLRREVLGGAVDLSAFEEVIYKVENEDLYLIGTAEHALVSWFADKTFQKEELPIKLCALTPCFRKEIGGHGVDTKGLFRMHQFYKVEQVVACPAEQSDKMLEEMQKITEEFFKSLELPFRVIEICSGDLGGKFARQYDIEAWFPRQGAYREVTSAGSCTDYQARRLNARYIEKGDGQEGQERKFLHLLNNTMVATSRAMVALLENGQQKDGSVKIPKVLWKYMHGVKVIKRR